MKRHIQTLVLTALLLIAGGMMNYVTAKKVTYHILTKPFTVTNYNNMGNYKTNIRVEALQCTSNESYVGLPDQFKSPLAKNFRYWRNFIPENRTYTYLYDYAHSTNVIEAKYYIYQCDAASGDGSYACLSNEILNPAETSTDAEGFPSDIYVTYEYDNTNSILSLDGITEYNVSLYISGKQRFMAYNRSRNNRVANALSTGLSGEDLASDDFVIPENGSSQLGWKWATWGPKGVHLGFKFVGADPYNITITTSYTGDELHITDAITGVDATGTIKPYEGATLFGKIGSNKIWFDASNDKHYKLESGIKEAGKWTDEKYAECKTAYTNATDAERYDTWVGFYRKEFPTINAYALLPNGDDGYMFVGSKMNQGNKSSSKPTINQPDKDGLYAIYNDNNNDPYFKFQAFSSAYKTNFYKIRTYTLKVKTHGSNTVLTKEIRWSDARASERIVNHVPDELKRKYVTFTGAYKEEALTNSISTFADAEAAGVSEIWLKYETNSEALPFEVLPAGGNYEDAHWYTMRMDGVANPKYIAYNDGSGNLVVTNGSGAAKGSNTASQIHQGENSAEAMVAFMGDPYELKILNRKACETAPAGNKFIGRPDGSAVETNLTTNNATSDITTWEIVYESGGVDGFLLRQFNTAADPKYIGLGSAANNKPVIYSATSSRIRVVDLDKVDYTYHVMRLDGTIAAKATVSQYVGKTLKSWLDIPTIIRSPFLSPTYSASVTYHDDPDDATSRTNAITNAPYNYSTSHDIYVRYSYGTPLTGNSYNVFLNAEYIYTNTTESEPVTDDKIYSKTSITEEEAGSNPFAWVLDYSDPYAMTIKNRAEDKYMKISSPPTDDTVLAWDDLLANASRFIVKQSGNNPGAYEVMYAAGDGVDASDTYYNIGRNISSTTANTVKLFSNTHYSSGQGVLRFSLIATDADEITYHLIDKAGKDLLKANMRQKSTDAPSFPPRFRSPLVDNDKYYYYTESQFDIEGEGSNKVYTLKSAQTPIPTIGDNSNIYVLYDVNDLIDMKRGQLYLLRYENGEYFHQEDGGDGLTTEPKKAVYPYVNGDCNFFVYDQEQYDLQQQGAASTRTRWAWYVDSDNNDPYHVKIMSRQSETYNKRENNAYFRTCEVSFKGDSHVVTTLTWPGISGDAATEYMILGNEGQYQLVTSNEISGSRYAVNSFEQYWKTFDTIRKKVYGDKDAKAKSSDPATIPLDTKAKFGSSTSKLLRDSLNTELGWHSYENWAYAKRWNGYNNGSTSEDGVTPEAKKGWEEIEHWYQTVRMGEGYFNFVETEINPVLILLDQHGWEIMRKPLPTSDEDPQKATKIEAISMYNSPMVKEYAFWATAKKRSGLHQYYLLSDRIGGDDYTSTDLAGLPTGDLKNVHDKKGNLNDQYVTYIVKDEYAQTYTPSTKTGKEFIIEQGSKYASTSNGTTITKNVVPDGGMQEYIAAGSYDNDVIWYIKPNWNIDYEMGYGDAPSLDWTEAGKKNPNAYDNWRYWDKRVATYISDKEITDSLGYFSFSNGFDPYNIQIMPKSYSASPNRKFMKTNATGAVLDDGVMNGVYKDVDPAIGLGDSIPTVDKNKCVWFDNRKLSVTNATFMAVQDAAGNMQLMPRFDANLRMSEFGELIAPTSAEVEKTYTKLYRAATYEYYIIDNSGHESIRYRSGGELQPQTPDHLKSPLATNFKYYATATLTGDIYSNITDEIEESIDGATLTDNKIYVRYEYDREADDIGILKGNWLTMQMHANKGWKYVQYVKTGGIFATEGIYPDDNSDSTKPATVDAAAKQWQWKFLETPQTDPDPYAVQIYNRDKKDLPMSSSSKNGNLVANSSNTYKYFTLLNHGNGDYALTLARTESYSSYPFLHGGSTMQYANTKTAKLDAGTLPNTDDDNRIKLYNEVEHTFTYKVYTNSGAFAISDTQDNATVLSNEFVPTLPSDIKSPLLTTEQYRYYSKDNVTFDGASPEPNIASTDTIGKNLSYIYGLYDDEVVVHYTPYDPSVTEYKVPNVRNTPGGTVAKGIGSNDAALDLSETLLYNVIWYNDNMMSTTDDTDVKGHANQAITTDKKHVWHVGGNDPYAMKFYNEHASEAASAGRYIHAASAADDAACTLDGSATTFMLLPKAGYDYGMFAITGNKDSKLTIPDDGNSGNMDAAKITTGDPAKFIIFALATHKVIYHLMIKNIGADVRIPYKDAVKTGGVLKESYKIKEGTTKRDLTTQDGTGSGHVPGDYYQLGESLKAIGERAVTTSGLFARDSIYCYDAGHISLGDELQVPEVFYRPNVKYSFVIEGVYDSTGASEVTEMNNKYKGVMTTNMGDDSELLLKTVFVNIIYSFDTSLGTNSGSDFVTSVDQNKWYAFETNDETPQLAQYTTLENLKTKSGHATHYTNDYMWTPVGDPYGFKMYNRYAYKNRGETSLVMTTADAPSAGDDIIMGNTESNSGYDVYELIAISTTTPGYFRIHPVVNKSGVQYYMNNNSSTGAMKLSIVPTEWTFGLSEDLMNPYYMGAGYVGGLNAAGKEAYDEAAATVNPVDRLMAIQDVVYNHDTNDENNYIVHYAPGYYRLHSQPASADVTVPRYMSGYTHKTELTAGEGGTAIPLHFYEKTEYDVNDPDFTDLEEGEYTVTPATRGELPLLKVNNDPASIFRFTGAAGADPTSTMQTQGLYVKENYMTETAGEATSLHITDIGGGVVLLHDGGDGGDRNFLSYDQSTKKYDIKYSNVIPARTARWCMKPVQKGTMAGDGEMALALTTNDGKDKKHYYATFYAPFDVQLTDAAKDTAYVVQEWKTTLMRPKKIGDVNTGTYAGNNQFIPANTPVIIRTTNTSGTVTLALPNTTPSSAVSCVFSGQYLEQMLQQSYDYNPDHSIDYVYVLGLDSRGTFVEDENFATNGLMTATLNTSGTDLEFYKNANYDHESAPLQSNWALNNKYVYANKIYYRADPSTGSAVSFDFKETDYVPVVFDFDGDNDEGLNIKPSGFNARPSGAYDAQGRCVATEEEVLDGSWRNRVAPGLYIVAGRKIVIK